MDIALSDELLAFQAEVRSFLEDNLTPEIREASRLCTTIIAEHEAVMRWHKIMYRQGWAAPGWPEEHGGPGWDTMRRYLFAAEYARAGAPRLAPQGLAMVAPAIMGHGSDEQKAYYLPRILSGEDVWCQGYSEPGSGSDLASLQCRAERKGDDYIINGSKIWTTSAHYANRMFCLVRTSTEGKPQAGITFLLLEMNTPGIVVEPIHILGGDHEFNQVFFTDARVPQANRVGAENEGWTVAKYLLEFERGGGARAAAQRTRLDEARRLATQRRKSDGRSLLDEPGFAADLAALEIELNTVEFTELRTMAEIAKRGSPGPASSMLKTRSTEVQMAISELAMRAVGYYAAPHQPEERLAGANLEPIGQRDEMSITARYLNDRAGSIYGGSNEIQRNIMAKLVLGM
ncbi:MAG: acyl-CoA dehydrogenase family protein [Alphaproteobacteria bacterium]|jgi:acyl-CoA dehydrogenase|nr:acyl-CoA dehydrogenase family protein [Alphaproteobacteria bacterium]